MRLSCFAPCRPRSHGPLLLPVLVCSGSGSVLHALQFLRKDKWKAFYKESKARGKAEHASLTDTGEFDMPYHRSWLYPSFDVARGALQSVTDQAGDHQSPYAYQCLSLSVIVMFSEEEEGMDIEQVRGPTPPIGERPLHITPSTMQAIMYTHTGHCPLRVIAPIKDALKIITGYESDYLNCPYLFCVFASSAIRGEVLTRGKFLFEYAGRFLCGHVQPRYSRYIARGWRGKDDASVATAGSQAGGLPSGSRSYAQVASAWGSPMSPAEEDALSDISEDVAASDSAPPVAADPADQMARQSKENERLFRALGMAQTELLSQKQEIAALRSELEAVKARGRAAEVSESSPQREQQRKGRSSLPPEQQAKQVHF